MAKEEVVEEDLKDRFEIRENYIYDKKEDRRFMNPISIEDGLIVEQDLEEFKKKLINKELLNQNIPYNKINMESNENDIGPLDGSGSITNRYVEQVTYPRVGNSVRLSRNLSCSENLVSDCPISFSEETTISQEFSGSVEVGWRSIISGGASFAWNTGSVVSQSLSETVAVPRGETGHARYMPNFDATSGVVQRVTAHGTVLSETPVVGYSPQKEDGVATGTIYVEY